MSTAYRRDHYGVVKYDGLHEITVWDYRYGGTEIKNFPWQSEITDDLLVEADAAIAHYEKRRYV